MLEAAKRIQFVTSKMASLIQAHSRPYPGQAQILDVRRSIAGIIADATSESDTPAADGDSAQSGAA